ncbi:lipocalin-like domain-containing protein [Neptunomonas japonica]|uniref:lipocalin-like domain-containing protein n=1 Tax=Neptunomonas japonica TaxID=417574 RepID=UPI0004005B3C|nr:lipocalin-like domain-containing protein [Neptunomonas japonica]
MCKQWNLNPLRRGLSVLCLLLLVACGPASESKSESGNSADSLTDVSGGDRAGFAGLGTSSKGYTHASSTTSISFPEDHGPHPDFRIEWWYLTANLENENREPMGIQWTLFRQAQQPQVPDVERGAKPKLEPWATNQLWMAHMALSHGDRHRVAERFARGASEPLPSVAHQAGVTAQPFIAWLDDWRLESLTNNSAGDTLDHLRLTAQAEDENGTFGYRLELKAEGPLVRHGIHGFSQKSADGQGSMYYSQPFYRVSGEVMLDGERVAVRGQAWLDREWSSQLLSASQIGWDWFSLHLDSGARLMAFRLRGGGKNHDDYLSGSWIKPDGEVMPLDGSTLTLVPLASADAAGHRIPVRWRLTLPEQSLDLEITARHANRWMNTSVPYWEGAVSVSDASSGVPRGEGYLEMTGY